MKTKDQKYNEAVKRNVKHLRMLRSNLYKKDMDEYKSIEDLRHRVGIRKNDKSFDKEIVDMVT